MHPQFEPLLATLAPDLQGALARELNRADFSGMLSATQADALGQAGGLDEDALCFALLPFAAAYALTPISHFNVGAVAREIDGSLYFGANMEFLGAPLQQTVHAEQSAINHAWLRGARRLRGLTVNYTPCGHCRQFMNELNSGADLVISLPERSPSSLAHYLPDAFGPRDLAIQSLLMDAVDHHFSLITGGPTTDEASATLTDALSVKDGLLQQALLAANQSHAPYSQAHSAVALQTVDGRIFAGRYAENAAFNPSLPPLQSALILLNMSGADCRQIQRAVLVERENAPFSQWDATQATLTALGCREIHRQLLTA